MTAITGEASLRALLAASSSQVATARKILDSNDPHNRLNGDTDAIMLDTAGKQIGRIFANGVTMIEDDAIDMFGGMDAIRNAMSQTDGVANRAAKLQAMLGNRGTVVDVAGYEKSRDLPKVAANTDKVDLSAAAREAMALLGKTEEKAEAPSVAAQMSAAVRAAEDARLAAAQDAARAAALQAPPRLGRKLDLTPEMQAEHQAYLQKAQVLRDDYDRRREALGAKMQATNIKFQNATKKFTEAWEKVPPFAVLRDAEGKEVGRIMQGGASAFDNRVYGMVAALWADGKAFDGGPHELFEAIRERLGAGFTIEKTGIEVDPQDVVQEERAAFEAARAEFRSVMDEHQAMSQEFRDEMAAIRPDWMKRMYA